MMRLKGFTLIEIMIVVAIVAILAAIAYPSYVNYVRKSRRADAEAALVAGAQQMERYFTQNNTYATATLTTAGIPSQTQDGSYTISFAQNSLTATGYQLQAVPSGPQAADPCGTLSYDQNGTKGVSTSAAISSCW